MLPLLADGDRLEIVQVPSDEIRVGDIVTYRDQHKYPTRRVVGFDAARSEFLIQADYKPARTFRVPSAAILGRVEARIRGSNRLARTSLRWRWAAWIAPYRKRIRQFLHRRKRRT